MIYDKITIGGSTVTDAFSSSVRKSTGENNISSSFSINLDNFNGKNASKYNIGDEVIFYADVDTNPPTTKIFTGILEDINFKSNELKESATLSGRDYTARLMDRTVEPEVYNNLPAGSIVKDIVAKYVNDLSTEITTTNVNNSPTTIQRITFNHTPVFDAVRQLANYADYTFYVDNDKDLHFEEKSSISSSYTFNSGNVYNAQVKEQRDTVFNEIWVYGDRYLDSFKEEFTAGDPVGGSEFTLTYKPHNTLIDVGSPITATTRQKGGILGLNVEVESGTNYLVGYDDKLIVFTSGTNIGDSIPASGTFITVDYYRSLPIVKVGRNQSSINAYGKRIKKIVDTNIKDPETAQELLNIELQNYSDPKKETNISVIGVVDVTPSQTCIVDLPHDNINNKTYDILEANYNFDKKRNNTEKVLKLKVNKKIDDVTDTLKDLISSVRTIEGQSIDTSDILTRFEYTTGSLGIRQSGLKVYTRSLAGSALVYNSEIYGIYDTNVYAGEEYLAGFAISNVNTAILGTSELGEGQLGPWALQWSGCYP